MRDVCISGFSSLTRGWANEMADHVEIWAMNEAHIYLKREPSLWFQVHPKNWNSRAAASHGWPTDGYGRSPEHLAYLQQLSCPVVQQEIDDRIPTSTKYPLDEIREAYGIQWVDGKKRNYLTSTAAWILAYAVYQHDNGMPIDHIYLSGIELAIGTEYFHQKPCVEYWCGMARGKGINVETSPGGSSLLTGPVYAVDNVDPLYPESMQAFAIPNQLPNMGNVAISEDESGNPIGFDE